MVIEIKPTKKCSECGCGLFAASLCEDCCQHGEYDHDICLDCGHERDPGDAIDRAYDRWRDHGMGMTYALRQINSGVDPDSGEDR
jgi:hypothetical protein